MSALADVPTDLPASLRVVDRLTAAAICGMSPREFDRWHADGRGPACLRFGRIRKYRLADLEAFLAELASAGE